jgi:hypothetical protein
MANWTTTKGGSPRGAVPGAPHAGAATPTWDPGSHTERTREKRRRRPTAVTEPAPAIRCNIPSTVTMPPKAQQLHGGRQVYICGLLRDHDGPHRWPADPITIIAMWE